MSVAITMPLVSGGVFYIYHPFQWPMWVATAGTILCVGAVLFWVERSAKRMSLDGWILLSFGAFLVQGR